MIVKFGEFRLGLQARYTLAILALVSCVVVVLSVALIIEFRISAQDITEASVRSTSDDLLEQLVERGTSMSDTLAENLINPLYEYDMERMQELLATMLNQRDVEVAVVVDAQRRIVQNGASYIDHFGDEFNAPTVEAALSEGVPKNHVGKELVYLSEPIRIGNEILGVVHLALSRKNTNERINASAEHFNELMQSGLRWNLYTALLSGLVIVIIGVGVAAHLARNLTEPISKLARLAGEIGQGIYPKDICLERKDELGELADAFNEMSRNLQNSTESIRHMAYHDSLTGLPNRASFQDLLTRTVAGCAVENRIGALMFIDLDHFKRINDTLGHQAGDALLCEVANRLSSVLRDEYNGVNHASDASGLARLGGDEFTVLLPRIGENLGAAKVATSLLKVLQEPYILADRPVVVSASIGITVFPADSNEPTELLKNADMALYHSKDAGRNAFHFFESAMNKSAMEQMELESELRQALNNSEFEIYYQCQIDGQDGNTIGAEALIRWHHPLRGLIAPAEFISIAEQTGMINPIGKWVLDQACKDAVHWRSCGQQPFYVAVNVSAVQLRNPEFAKDVAAALHNAGLDPHELHIEITETSLMQNEEAAAIVIRELQEQGVEVWMDDFGTGYSSLSYLRKFPIRGVKIDYSFIRDIVDDLDDRAIVSAIIAMAKNLNIQVIAEGVETLQQMRMLQHAQCDRLQGFLFGLPVPADKFIQEHVVNDTSVTLDEHNRVRRAG